MTDERPESGETVSEPDAERGASRDSGEHLDPREGGTRDASRRVAEAAPPPRTERSASGRAAFVSALRVRQNAKWGLAVGLAFTAAVFVLFVVLPGAQRSPLWYVALGFVLAMSTAGLVAFLLTLGRAVRLSRRL